MFIARSTSHYLVSGFFKFGGNMTRPIKENEQWKLDGDSFNGFYYYPTEGGGYFCFEFFI